MRGLQGSWLPMWLVVGLAGCAHETTTYQDDLVHTDQPGHQQAHGHEPRLPDAIPMSGGLPAVKLPARGAPICGLMFAAAAPARICPSGGLAVRSNGDNENSLRVMA